MKHPLSFAVVGGDLRQIQLAKSLADDGHNVRAYGFDKFTFSEPVVNAYNFQELMHPTDCIVLPLPIEAENGTLFMPFNKEPLSTTDILSLFTPGQIVIGGKIKNALFEYAAKRSLRLYDLLEREDFNIANAIPTAEGALELAMQKTKTTIFGMNVLVCGYGKIGKVLAHRLNALGARVCVSARKHGDFETAKTYGLKVMHTNALNGNLGDFDMIFNTVPRLIFTRELLSQLKDGAILLDLASKPGGTDFKAAIELNIKAFHELSLPGRVAPVSAGRIMCETIYNIIDD